MEIFYGQMWSLLIVWSWLTKLLKNVCSKWHFRLCIRFSVSSSKHFLISFMNDKGLVSQININLMALNQSRHGRNCPKHVTKELWGVLQPITKSKRRFAFTCAGSLSPMAEITLKFALLLLYLFISNRKIES